MTEENLIKYYIDDVGNFAGGYGGISPVIPEGLIEVPIPPQHASQKWNFNIGSWDQIPEEITIKNQISDLEAQQTSRRMREASLGTDGGWLENLNQQIEQLRSQLN